MHKALATMVTVMAVTTSASAIPAFPGAEGFGAGTPGGRGGKVMFVTTLADAGPGSLRAAIEAEGPRTVVFRTGGRITIQSSLRIRNPYITIAGQTAPGDGIEIENDPYGSRAADSFASIVIDTHDVVIRYVRIRPGIPQEDPLCSTGQPHPDPLACRMPNDIDAIALEGAARDIVIDHVSASWATDELIGAGSARDLTVQWSLLAEGINHVHYSKETGYEGKGMLLGNGASALSDNPSVRVSIHHNLWAHNTIRSPQIATTCNGFDPSRCVSDVVNNVVYNWRQFATLVANHHGVTYANVVGNTYLPGPDSLRDAGVDLRFWESGAKTLVPGAELSVFATDNVGEHGEATPVRCYLMDPDNVTGRGVAMTECNHERFSPAYPYAAPAIETQSSGAAYPVVLAEAGASRSVDAYGEWIESRDATDARIVSEVERGEGRIIDSADEVPAREDRRSGRAAADADNDGMPNAWEQRFGLRMKRASASDDTDGDGYTDLEEYLNGTPPVRSADTDLDNIPDTVDNCRTIANGTLEAHTVGNQCDTDGDGFGNICDGDFDSDGEAAVSDWAMLANALDTTRGDAGFDANLDLDCNSTIDFIDLQVFGGLYGRTLGLE
jgi:pectate lyase